jgi:uncharacterized protein with PQ loop repeat
MIFKTTITPQRCLIATSIFSSLSTYHQVHKIRKRKCSKHISLPNVSAVWLNMTTNLIYAISIHNTRLMFTFGNSFISLSTLLGHVLYYI